MSAADADMVDFQAESWCYADDEFHEDSDTLEIVF